MVLASTILSIALGLTPVQEGQIIREPAASPREIGRYSEFTNRQGVRYLRGFDKQGRPYRVTVTKTGQVEAYIGGQVLEFTIAEAR